MRLLTNCKFQKGTVHTLKKFAYRKLREKSQRHKLHLITIFYANKVTFLITPFFSIWIVLLIQQIEKTMNSFKEKFKIAKILASLFTHSSIPEEEKAYREWI